MRSHGLLVLREGMRLPSCPVAVSGSWFGFAEPLRRGSNLWG